MFWIRQCAERLIVSSFAVPHVMHVQNRGRFVMRWLCTAVISNPAERNFHITGFISSSSRTRSPITAASFVPVKAPRNPGLARVLTSTPSTET